MVLKVEDPTVAEDERDGKFACILSLLVVSSWW